MWGTLFRPTIADIGTTGGRCGTKPASERLDPRCTEVFPEACVANCGAAVRAMPRLVTEVCAVQDPRVDYRTTVSAASSAAAIFDTRFYQACAIHARAGASAVAASMAYEAIDGRPKPTTRPLTSAAGARVMGVPTAAATHPKQRASPTEVGTATAPVAPPDADKVSPIF